MSGFEKMKQGLALTCPNCGFQLAFDPKTQLFLCKNFNSKFNEAEIHKRTTKFEAKDTYTHRDLKCKTIETNTNSSSSNNSRPHIPPIGGIRGPRIGM